MICWKDSSRREFDSWSASYDRSFLQRLFFRPSHDKILDAISIPESGVVLDVGCGTGQFVRRLADFRPDVSISGIDLSEKMLAIAEKTCSALADRIELVKGDSERLPFPDRSFDVVTCSHSFHHYPNQEAVAREMFRVLKPGGSACVVDGNRDGWWGWMVFDGIVTTIERNVHHCSAKRFRNLFAAAGFESTTQSTSGNVAPFLVNVAKRRSAQEIPAFATVSAA